MARLRTPIEREPAEGLLGRVARPIAKPAPVAPKPVVEPPPAVAPAVAAPAPAAQGFPDNWMNEFKRTGQVPDSLLKAWEAEGWMPVIQGGPNPWAAHAEYGLQLGKIPQPGYSSHASVNADGSIGETKTTKDSGSLLKAGLLKAAPIVLSLAAPGLGSAIGAGLGAGTGLAGSVVGGAVIGGGTAALSGGNILRGAAMGGLGGGASYGLGGVSEVPGGVDNYDLQGNFDLNPGYVLPSAPIDPDKLFQSDPVPGYDFTSPNFDLPDPGLVNNPLTNTPAPGFTTPDGLAPGSVNSLLDAANNPSIIDLARTAGKTVTDYVKDPANALTVKAAMAAGGALLNTVGGSSSGGSSYKDDGYRPTISRGGFQASIPGGSGMAPGAPGMAPGGPMSGISLPSSGQANDGLWRYGSRQGGLLPSLASAMPRSPQTGLINPPAVANYDPTGGMRGMVPTNSPQPGYGYDDPVPLNQTRLSPEMQRAMSPFLGLLNTSPTPRGWA